MKDDENIVKDWRLLELNSLEEIIEQKVSGYIGKTQQELKEEFKVESSPKNLNMLLFSKMIGLAGEAENAHEFRNANITLKRSV